MPKITYIDPDGTSHPIDAPVGQSVMEVAIANSIKGIVAECNGSLACATCHVWLDEDSAARLEAPGPHEAEMLEFTAAECRPTSRLSCQVKLEDRLDGMVITIPPTQV